MLLTSKKSLKTGQTPGFFCRFRQGENQRKSAQTLAIFLLLEYTA
jgi:hypothetical protein